MVSLQLLPKSCENTEIAFNLLYSRASFLYMFFSFLMDRYDVRK
ncbi:MAG: hypothetical protein ACJAZ4_000366 [Neptuniibacter pectenicola]|jgi:hypothetical protein